MISEFREDLTGRGKRARRDERDALPAPANLHLLSKQGRVLVRPWSGRPGEGNLKHLEPSREYSCPWMSLNEKPGKKITFVKIFGIVVSLLILVAPLVWCLITAESSEIILQACVIWFVVTGGLSALGVVLARGHPLSVLTALMVAWMTTLNPFVAAGWFAGMVEAWKAQADRIRPENAGSCGQL